MLPTFFLTGIVLGLAVLLRDTLWKVLNSQYVAEWNQSLMQTQGAPWQQSLSQNKVGKNMTGMSFDIQKYSLRLDGPRIRTLLGFIWRMSPMRCRWAATPDHQRRAYGSAIHKTASLHGKMRGCLWTRGGLQGGSRLWDYPGALLTGGGKPCASAKPKRWSGSGHCGGAAGNHRGRPFVPIGSAGGGWLIGGGPLQSAFVNQLLKMQTRIHFNLRRPTAVCGGGAVRGNHWICVWFYSI